MTPLATVAPTPWRNGGGGTRELLVWPHTQTGQDWQLRLSVAHIDSDGPFSTYPGVHRWLALVSGAGVALHWPQGHTTQLTPSSGVLRFDGGQPPTAQRIHGPVQDFNLMSRSPHAGLTPVVAGQAWQPPCTTTGGQPMLCGLFACTAGVLHVGHTAHPLPAMCLYHCTHPQVDLPWQFTPHPANHPLGWWFHFQPATYPTKGPLP